MDLKTTEDVATDEERRAVDSVIGSAPPSWSDGLRPGVGGRVILGGQRRRANLRHLLLPALHAIQDQIGWISHGALNYVCTRLDIAPAEAFGVASSYSLFSLQPTAQTVVHVCDDIACLAAGSDSVETMRDRLGEPDSTDGQLTWRTSPCLGQCEHGSAAMVTIAGSPGVREVLAPFNIHELDTVVSNTTAKRPPTPATLLNQVRSELHLLKRIGLVDPESLDSYRSEGGYQALRRAIDFGPEWVIRELKDAKLLGRGGAAFPTGAKWEAVAHSSVRPRYFVANADESEPGTFKDRVLIENDPFALVEALTIAGVTTGAEQGYIYIRGEYPLGERRLRSAITQAQSRGLLGDDIMGSGLKFQIEVRRGAGAYIAGEETALFNSIEGHRPEPRTKPPYPVDKGLFAKPTGINNVETLLSALEIISSGAAEFIRLGTESSTGTRMFCLSGCVNLPGIYEVPLGTKLGELIQIAGGVTEGHQLKAILLGGAAGSFVGPDQLDLELSFEAVREAGTTLGSGVVIVIDETVDMVAFVRRIAQFFRDESCGQCVPCRVGTVRQEEVLARLSLNAPLGSRQDELSLLDDLGSVMRDASICGLGQAANAAVLSAIEQQLIFSSKGNS